jgi:23S rRNA pseudouridine1911/1915/1917 synthase
VAPQSINLTVEADHDGLRLDRYLVAVLPGASRKVARSILKADAVRIGGRKPKKGDRVRVGDLVTVEGYLSPEGWSPQPDHELEIPILYYDDDLIAVDKPAGIACHPLKRTERGTVASALVARFPELVEAGDVPREAGLIHRLDTSTSGVLIFGRHRVAFDDLVGQVRREDKTAKVYDALVFGDAMHLDELCDPILSKGRRVKVVTEDQRDFEAAQPARTVLRPVKRLGGFTLLEVLISAGRRHQIRAHLGAAGFPILGDELYGATPTSAIERPFLHARRIELRSPSTGKTLRLEAPLAQDLARILEQLEGQQGS